MLPSVPQCSLKRLRIISHGLCIYTSVIIPRTNDSSAVMPQLHSIHEILFSAVVAGAREVLTVKLTGNLNARLKDATELVTEADRRSDAAILTVFQARL